MKNNILFGFAAVVLSISGLIHSLHSAFAGPNGPNVSYGGNPIENFSVKCTNSSQALIPSTITSDFIVTDIITGPSYYGGQTELTFNNGITLSLDRNQSHQFSTGLKVPAGTALGCQSSYSNNNYLFNVTVLGYFTHS